MKPADLARMANQIADFFAAYPADEAPALVADHIVMFWAPVMRRDLAAMLDAGDEATAGLKPLALAGAMIAVGRGHDAA